MDIRSKKGMSVEDFKFIFITFLATIILFNFWIRKHSKDLKEHVPSPKVVLEEPKEEVKDLEITGEVIRKEHLDPSREFSLNILFADGKEIARFKSVEDKIYDIEGKIPDGKVKFINEAKRFYGIENYKNNKRHGTYSEYYFEGKIHKRIEYFYGKKRTMKEYFIDGQVRMESDYTDALFFTNDFEAGRGRIYYRDGTIMYEWNLTNADPNRFKKSYNIKGELSEEKYFDEYGKITRLIEHRKK